jgi:hypothetical protein
MVLLRPWPAVVVVVVVVDNSVPDDPTTTHQAQQELPREHQVKAKIAVMEPEVVVVAVDKMVVQEVQLLVAMTVLFQVKMATVWHPEVV